MSQKPKHYISDIPELMAEWHWEKNNELGLDPSKITYGSGKQVWWICEKGHEWQAMVRNRLRDKPKANCPICSGHKVLIGYNDLATKRPDLVQQWHSTKNGDLKPIDVTCGSSKQVWWKCAVCGHEWSATIASRACKNTGCLACKNKKQKLPVPIEFNAIVKMQKTQELTVIAAQQYLNMSHATYYRRIKELQL